MSIMRRVRQIKRVLDAEQVKLYEAGWQAMLALPWRMRVRLAWKLARGKGKQ